MLGKSVTVKQIEKYLDRRGWSKHHAVAEPGEKEGTVLTGWRASSGEVFGLLIDPIIETSVLILRVPKILHAKPDSIASDRLSGLLMMMSYLNYELMLGNWIYDPSDGEVAFKLGIPIDDGDLSYENFDHCVRALVASVEVDASNLRAITDGSKSALEMLRKEGARV